MMTTGKRHEISFSRAVRFGEVLGASVPMRALLARLQRLAAEDPTVLIVGESGTGKELIARALHAEGNRAGSAREHDPRRVCRKVMVSVAGVLGASAVASPALADNPIVQTNYTADPAPMVYGGTMYLFTGHDENVAGMPCSSVAGYTMCNWRVYSSTDMVNWTDHGSPMSVNTFTWVSTAAWAAQAIFRNGKFYYYAPMTARSSGAMAIGVGVSTSPIGPYQDALGQPLVSAACPGASGDIDPTVFIDDDGQAYLYFGRSSPCYVKLNADMISYTGGVVGNTLTAQTFGPPPAGGGFNSQYEEGPWFFKRNGTYFLAYAANGIPEDISYSKSTGPNGPWTYGGPIMKAAGASFTNQTGIVDYNGHSYFFYHNVALPAGDGYHRSVCVEEFSYNADGSLPTIQITTSGPKAIANLNPYVQTEAETIAWESGVQTEVTSDTGGGMDVTAITNGDYIKVKNVDFGTGAISFDERVASSANGGSIELHLDSLMGTLIGTCAVASTGGAQTWTTESCTVSGATGVHDLFLRFTGGSGDLFNFNWWKFTPRDARVLDAGVPDAGATNGGSGSSGSSGSSSASSGGGSSGGSSSGSDASSSGDPTGSSSSGSGSSGPGSSSSGGNGETANSTPAPTRSGAGCGCGATLGTWNDGSGSGFLAVVVLAVRRRRSRPS